MISRRTKILLKNYLNGKATLMEKAKVDKWYEGMEEKALEVDLKTDVIKEQLLHKIELHLKQDQKNRIVFLPANRQLVQLLAAACFGGIVLFGAYRFLNKELGSKNKPSPALATKDVTAPKGSKAMITLGSGRIIPLDSINSGVLANEGEVNVLKNADGSIIYSGHADVAAFNTLTNPRGSGVVSISLADGTRLWLNSESSIKYPTSFAGNEREVEITGEAYFEVKPVAVTVGRKMPFLVHVNTTTTGRNGLDVIVLGTHFNIKANSDEKFIKTTLLEGSVKIVTPAQSSLLSPNQQAMLVQGKADITIKDGVDVNEAIAWKNGFFQFENADLETVMQQLARWYDVTVIYQNKNRFKDHFKGKIPRSFSLSEVLKILELNDIRVRIQGKTLFISN